jgi:hypothetical protein
LRRSSCYIFNKRIRVINAGKFNFSNGIANEWNEHPDGAIFCRRMAVLLRATLMST